MISLIKAYKLQSYARRKGWHLFGLALTEAKRGNKNKFDFYIRNANRFYQLSRGQRGFSFDRNSKKTNPH